MTGIARKGCILRTRGSIAIYFLGISFLGSIALAADPPIYIKKDTWQETICASREALMQHELKEGKGTPLPDFGKSDFTITAWIKTSGGGTIVSKASVKGIWSLGGKTFFVGDNRLTFDVGWVGAVEGKRGCKRRPVASCCHHVEELGNVAQALRGRRA